MHAWVGRRRCAAMGRLFSRNKRKVREDGSTALDKMVRRCAEVGAGNGWCGARLCVGRRAIIAYVSLTLGS